MDAKKQEEEGEGGRRSPPFSCPGRKRPWWGRLPDCARAAPPGPVSTLCWTAVRVVWGVCSIALASTVLHSLVAHVYAWVCAPPAVWSLLFSAFTISSPGCNALLQLQLYLTQYYAILWGTIVSSLVAAYCGFTGISLSAAPSLPPLFPPPAGGVSRVGAAAALPRPSVPPSHPRGGRRERFTSPSSSYDDRAEETDSLGMGEEWWK